MHFMVAFVPLYCLRKGGSVAKDIQFTYAFAPSETWVKGWMIESYPYVKVLRIEKL